MCRLVQKELDDAEFIPMPEDGNLPTPDQLASFSESVTLPYGELKELKAAAAAVGSRNGLWVMLKSRALLPSQCLSHSHVTLSTPSFQRLNE